MVEKRVSESEDPIKKREKHEKKAKREAEKQTLEIESLEATQDASKPQQTVIITKAPLKDGEEEEKVPKVPDVEDPKKGSNCLDYIRLFKSNPTEWKFQKNKQNWILKQMWNSEKVPKEEFDICKKYILKLTGAARKVTLEKAHEILKTDAQHDRAKSVVKILSKPE